MQTHCQMARTSTHTSVTCNPSSRSAQSSPPSPRFIVLWQAESDFRLAGSPLKDAPFYSDTRPILSVDEFVADSLIHSLTPYASCYSRRSYLVQRNIVTGPFRASSSILHGLRLVCLIRSNRCSIPWLVNTLNAVDDPRPNRIITVQLNDDYL